MKNRVFPLPPFCEANSDLLNEYSTEIKSFFSLNGLTNFCDAMDAVPGDAFESFARWVDDTFGSSQCYDHTFKGQVERFGNVQWNTVGTDNGSNTFINFWRTFN